MEGLNLSGGQTYRTTRSGCTYGSYAAPNFSICSLLTAAPHPLAPVDEELPSLATCEPLSTPLAVLSPSGPQPEVGGASPLHIPLHQGPSRSSSIRTVDGPLSKKIHQQNKNRNRRQQVQRAIYDPELRPSRCCTASSPILTSTSRNPLRLKKVTNAKVSTTNVLVTDLPHSKPGFIGLVDKGTEADIGAMGLASEPIPPATKPITEDMNERLVVLLKRGYTYYESDPRRDHLLVDQDGRVHGAILAIPSGMRPLAFRLHLAGRRFREAMGAYLKPAGRRGGHECAHYGISMGGGQEEPMPFHDNVRCKEQWDELLSDPAVVQFFYYVTDAFYTIFPRLSEEYRECQQALYKQNPSLPSPNPWFLPWSNISANVGEQSCCAIHRDHANLVHGICACIPSGRYDHTTGGHLVLHEPRQIFEVRSGQPTMFLSAAIMHENIPIKKGEERHSFVLYSAGGLFRWKEYGFRTWTTFGKEDKAGQLQFAQETLGRWKKSWERSFPITNLYSWWKGQSD